jgi:hypothetical protein
MKNEFTWWDNYGILVVGFIGTIIFVGFIAYLIWGFK